MRTRIACALAFGLLAASSPAAAQNAAPGWAALASDRTAETVGDSLTVVIMEASSAAATAQSGSRRDNRLGASISAGGNSEAMDLGVQGAFDGRGQVNRSGRLLGQIGVRVEEVLPNGDLKVAGAQTLQIDGETTAIRLTGRVRPADIAGDNTVLSSRLADAQIVYDGHGDLARNSRPGPLAVLLSWFGL
jgi:flagellar L-ring protein precursor FlgH